MNTILAMPNVLPAPEGAKFTNNVGTAERILGLQSDLRGQNRDPTVYVHAPAHDPTNVYFIAKVDHDNPLRQ